MLRYGAMRDAARNDEKVTFVELDGAVAEFHAEAAADDEEEFVFIRVIVPHELALEFDELHVLPVQFADDARIPVVGDERELFVDVDANH